MTTYTQDSYGFVQKTGRKGQVLMTNAYDRTILFRELAVAKDAAGNVFIGFCAEIDGIADGASGYIDLMEAKEIETGQIVSGELPTNLGNGMFVLEQTDASPALLKKATATGLFPIPVQVTEKSSDPLYIKMRMPYQNGDIVAVPA